MDNQMIQQVAVEMLSEYPKASDLIPEMTKTEFNDHLESIKKSGIQVPIHITKDHKILDGRHRWQAAKTLNIKEIPSITHDFSEEEAIAFVRDTAIERRNLTPEQKLNIILQSDELIKGIYKEAIPVMK